MAIIIPAENIQSINSFSAIKSNVYNKITLNNAEWTQSVSKRNYDVFNVSNALSNSVEDWDVIYNDGETQNVNTILTLFAGDITYDSEIRIVGSLSLTAGVNAHFEEANFDYDCGSKRENFEFDLYLEPGASATRSVSYTGRFPMDTNSSWTATTQCIITFTQNSSGQAILRISRLSSGNGNNNTDGIVYSSTASASITLTEVTQLKKVSDENTFSVSFTQSPTTGSGIFNVTYSFLADKVDITQESDAFLALKDDLKYTISIYSDKETTGEVASVNEPESGRRGEIGLIENVNFSSVAAFTSWCQNLFASAPSMNTIGFIWIDPLTVDEVDDEILFFKEITVYLCLVSEITMNYSAGGILTGNITYSNFQHELFITAAAGTSWERENNSVSFGSGSKEFTITANEFFQENTKINGMPITQEVGNNILNKYKNGRNTASLTIFYTKYLDTENKTVYNGSDGRFITTDDICIPYIIRNGVSEPLQRKSDGMPMEYIVTSSQFSYNGLVTVSLEMIENT